MTLAFILNGCKPKGEVVAPEENTSKVGDVVITEMKQIVTKTIGQEGGEVEIRDAQSSLNSFKITVPSGAYPGGGAFSVSAANVVKHGFGDEYKVLSPLISVSAPSGYIDDFVTIEIPIKLPENHFAAAILIDGNGLVDVLPVINLFENKLTVGVNSFSKIVSSKSGRTGDVQEGLQFLVTSIDKSELLDYEGPVEGAFKPGVDDWAFANRGSVLASGGYCSASAISAVWYFTQRKKITNIPLHDLGAASNAPAGFKPKDLEQSNSLGIKYVSLLQNSRVGLDKTATTYIRKLYNNTSKVGRDFILYYYASFYLRILKRPLHLGLKRSAANLEGGHMITIIGKKGETLMLSNPNAPRTTQLLVFNVNSGLKSFVSGESAEQAFDYDVLFALPQFIFDRDALIQNVWEQGFANSTAENSPEFPSLSYIIKSVGENVTKVSLSANNVSKISSSFLVGISAPANITEMQVVLYTANGSVLEPSTDYYVLPTGKQKIGILVKAVNKDNKKSRNNRISEGDESSTDIIPRWADFRWFDVEVVGEEQDFKDCRITTAEGISVATPGEIGKEYTFSLGATCSFPQKTIFFWDFGDGTTDETVDKQVSKHKFSKSGDFTVRLRALPPGTANYVVRELKIRISDTLPQYYVRFTVGSNEYVIPRYTGDAISFNNHTYGSRRESWPSLFAAYDDRKGGQSYSAFLSIDFYNNTFKGVGNYTIAAPLDTDIMLSPYASRTEFYTSLPSKGAVVNAYINSFADPDLLGRAGGNVKITKYEKGNIIEGTFEFVADEYVNGRFTLKNQTITGSFRIRPLFDN